MRQQLQRVTETTTDRSLGQASDTIYPGKIRAYQIPLCQFYGSLSSVVLKSVKFYIKLVGSSLDIAYLFVALDKSHDFGLL